MSRRVSDERLETIHLQLSDAIRRIPGAWVYDHNGHAICEGHDLICLLDELRRRRQEPGTRGAKLISPHTQVLMDMKVGETVDFPPMPQSTLTTLRGTARKRMGIPDARWHSETQEDGYLKVTRLYDGAPQIYGRAKNPAVKEMASMKLGEVRILTTLPGKMHAGIKQQARIMMDYAGADWRCKNLANGNIEVRRIR